MNDRRIDCIVRFHDLRHLQELNRCIFSLVGQRYRPLHVLLVLQRFTASETETVREELSPLLRIPDAPTLELLDWDSPVPLDGRAAMLNFGLDAARGDYVGFLDYDDVLYPEAYRVLAGQLQKSGAAIAFASVRLVRAEVYPEFVHATRVADPVFGGRSLRDLLAHNFCPIHSYLIDRSAVAPEVLACNPDLTMEEDYDLLLRLCARYRCDFALLPMQIGDYYFTGDGRDAEGKESALSGQRIEAYKHVSAMIEQRRATTTVAPEVQRALGLPAPLPGLTIRGFLDLISHAPNSERA